MDYTGEVGVILINLSNEPFAIKSGERIAQMVISTYSTVQWDNVESLTKTGALVLSGSIVTSTNIKRLSPARSSMSVNWLFLLVAPSTFIL